MEEKRQARTKEAFNFLYFAEESRLNSSCIIKRDSIESRQPNSLLNEKEMLSGVETSIFNSKHPIISNFRK